MLQGKAVQTILGQSFLFKGLPDELTVNALSQGEVIFFERDSIIYTPNSYRKAIGFILAGTACAQNGEKLVLNTLRMGDCFGVAGLFHSSTRYVTTIVAKTDTYVLFLSDTVLMDLFSKDTRAAVNYISFLSKKIEFLNKKIDSFAAPTTHKGLCAYLRSATPDSDGAVTVSNGYSQLAKQLNMGRASLYRNLDALEKDGIIRREHRKIIILKPEKLK
ncbi:MAG: Crp/Fnr family transcriptional regulator [Oscillospiraceae bacterium]|nr:Crp/Fnr family transcriptional regulator [Oscillospiraceae bacterium]